MKKSPLRWAIEQRLHVTIWSVLILYIIIAPGIQYRFYLKEGKPATIKLGELVETKHVRGSVEVFEPTEVEGQFLYSARGWTFSTKFSGLPQNKYVRSLLLLSDNITYSFVCEEKLRTDVEKAFPEIKLDLSNSGCEVLIAKEAVKEGTYQLGFGFTNAQRTKTTYTRIKKIVIRTPNNLLVQDQMQK